MSCWGDRRRSRGAVWTIGPCPPGSAQSPAEFRKIPPRPQSPGAIAKSRRSRKKRLSPAHGGAVWVSPAGDRIPPGGPCVTAGQRQNKKEVRSFAYMRKNGLFLRQGGRPFPVVSRSPAPRKTPENHMARAARAPVYSLFSTRCTVVWVALKKPKSRIVAPERA